MKVYVESHGCANNQGLGEGLKEGLLEAGLFLAERRSTCQDTNRVQELRHPRLPQIPGREIRRRSRIMTRVAKAASLEMNGRRIGWRGPATVSEEAPNYKTIIADGRLQIGGTVNVSIRDVDMYCLFGEAEGFL